jgi:hypothetical protein
MYTDSTLTCRDCGQSFVFTVREQGVLRQSRLRQSTRALPGLPCGAQG